MPTRVRLFAVAVLIATASALSGQNLLLNSSFELGSGFVAADWTASDPAHAWRSHAVPATNGSYVLFVQPGYSISQVYAPAFEADRWTLSASIMDPSVFQLSGINYGELELRFTGSYGSESHVSAPFDAEQKTDLWIPWSVSATAPAGTTGVEFLARLVELDTSGGGALAFDYFSATQISVPEPSTLSLLALGGATITARLRRGRKRAT